MWTPADRALVGDFGSGQALTDDQFRLLKPLIPPAKPGGRLRTTDMRRLLDGLFSLVRTGCQWRHLSKDYEALLEVSEAMVTLAMVRLMLHRLAHPSHRRLPAP